MKKNLISNIIKDTKLGFDILDVQLENTQESERQFNVYIGINNFQLKSIFDTNQGISTRELHEFLKINMPVDMDSWNCLFNIKSETLVENLLNPEENDINVLHFRTTEFIKNDFQVVYIISVKLEIK